MEKLPDGDMNLIGKMITGFLIVVAISGIGFITVIYKSEQVLSDVIYLKEFEFPRLEKINIIHYNSQLQATSIRNYLLTGKENYLDTYKKTAEENARIEQSMVDNASTEARKKKIMELKALDDKYNDIVIGKIIPLIQEGKRDEALFVIDTESAPTNRDLNKEINEYKQVRDTAINKALDNAVADARDSTQVAVIAAVVSLVLGLVIGFLVARIITAPVNRLNSTARKVADGDLTQYLAVSSKDEIGQLTTSFNTMISNLKNLLTKIHEQSLQVATSSEELTASTDQSSATSSQIADSINKVSLGTEQQLKAVDSATNIAETITAELKEVSGNVTMVAENAVKTAETATNGGKSASKAIDQMKEIEKTVSDSAAVVSRLGDRSKEIGQIIDTIAGIASQTNLLALNAAIEAARAGEQGRGFAVVAEEVRKLAEQSQEAAKRITSLISEIQSETDMAVTAMENGTREVKIGTEVVNETGISFQEIVLLVEQVSTQVQGISVNIGNIAQNSEQVVLSMQDINTLSKSSSEAIHTVSAATDEQSATMEEIAVASLELSKMSDKMKEVVMRFHM